MIYKKHQVKILQNTEGKYDVYILFPHVAEPMQLDNFDTKREGLIAAFWKLNHYRVHPFQTDFEPITTDSESCQVCTVKLKPSQYARAERHDGTLQNGNDSLVCRNFPECSEAEVEAMVAGIVT